MEFVKPPDVFNFEEPNAPQRWARWEKQFETYFVAAELAGKSQEVQVARLLNAAGPEAQEVHELFTYEAEEDKKDYKKILKKFSEYCRPKKNIVYERHRFWSRSQKEGEPFDRWLKELRIIAKDCEFTEEDNMIRDKIVFSVFDKKVQERMLRKSDLTLKDAMDTCRAAESSQNQLSEIRKGDGLAINEVGGGSGRQVKCFKCSTLGHVARECPTQEELEEEKEVQCFNCRGFGHKSSICPNGDSFPAPRRKKGRGRGRGRARGRRGRFSSGSAREIHEVEDAEMEGYTQEFAALSLSTISAVANAPEDSSKPQKTVQDDQSLQCETGRKKVAALVKSVRVSSVSESVKKRYVKFRVHDVLLRKSMLAELKIDSGAEANVMPLKMYRRFFPERFGKDGLPLKRFLRKSDRRLEAYGGVNVPHMGTVNMPCEYNGKKFMCRFFLCNIEGAMLLGLPTCEGLGIVKITVVNEMGEKSAGVDEEVESKESDKGILVPRRGGSYIDPGIPISERPPITSKEDLKEMYPECFEDQGKHFLDFEYTIKIDESVPPKAHPSPTLVSP